MTDDHGSIRLGLMALNERVYIAAKALAPEPNTTDEQDAIDDAKAVLKAIDEFDGATTPPVGERQEFAAGLTQDQALNLGGVMGQAIRGAEAAAYERGHIDGSSQYQQAQQGEFVWCVHTCGQVEGFPQAFVESAAANEGCDACESSGGTWRPLYIRTTDQ